MLFNYSSTHTQDLCNHRNIFCKAIDFSLDFLYNHMYVHHKRRICMKLEYVVNKLAEGNSYSDIARSLGISRQAVCDFCKRKGLSKQKKTPVETEYHKRKAAFPFPEAFADTRIRFTRKRQNVLGAKKWEWALEFEDITWPSHCPILGLKLEYNSPFDKKVETSLSFDRIDSSKGYIKGNVHIISWRANRIKNDGTAEEHRKIADFLDNYDN